MIRIKGAKIQYGESFVLPIDKVGEEKPDSPEKIKLKEELFQLEKEVEEAKLKKQELINQGQTEASNLIEKTKAEITVMKEEAAKQLEAEALQTKEEAYKTGYEDGYKQGFQTITMELEDKVRAVDIFAKSQFALKNNIIKSSELDIVNLVIEIAQKICTKSLNLNSDLIRIITVNAIKALKDKEDIKIIVNPQLVEIINTVSDKLMQEIPQLKSIKIIEDNNISPDGTIVESLLTRVDSRVKAQINEIADKMMSGYNSEDMDDFSQHEANIIEDIEEIQLSDDVNIDEFLEELEDIHSIDDKARDEDAHYYSNINLEELQDEIENVPTVNDAIEEINLDNYEIEDLEKMVEFSNEELNVEESQESEEVVNTELEIEEKEVEKSDSEPEIEMLPEDLLNPENMEEEDVQ